MFRFCLLPNYEFGVSATSVLCECVFRSHRQTFLDVIAPHSRSRYTIFVSMKLPVQTKRENGMGMIAQGPTIKITIFTFKEEKTCCFRFAMHDSDGDFVGKFPTGDWLEQHTLQVIST